MIFISTAVNTNEKQFLFPLRDFANGVLGM